MLGSLRDKVLAANHAIDKEKMLEKMRLHFSFFLLKIYFFRNKTNEFHIKCKDHVAKINYRVEA